MTTIEEKDLLAKLDELNRSFQMDSKSVPSLSFIVRNDSITSELNILSSIDEDKLSLSSVTAISPNLDHHNHIMDKWNSIVNNWQQSSRRKSQVKDLIKQSGGIPHYFRPLVWQLMCGSNDENSLMHQLKTHYPEYLKQQSPCEKAIRRDITRTYPQHDLFKDPDGDGQERLFNIMKAYSIHDREVGYCQGSGFIGGLLLIQMPEEDAFSVLVSLLFEHQLRNLYKPNMSELGLCMFQLDCLVEDQLPKLASHFRSHNFHATVYASGWFLTLFTLPFSIDLASRVMDLFIIEGFEVIYKISLAYLTLFQDELLKMDMELMLRFLQSRGPQILEEDPNKLFDLVFQIKLNTRRMKKSEKEYLAQKIEDEVNQVELRRLRTENGLLLQRIDRLEKETEQLKQHLVSKNLQRKENTEEIAQLKSELLESNRKVDNLRLNLKAAETQLQSVLGQLNGQITEAITMDRLQDRRSSDLPPDIVGQLQTQLVGMRLKEADTNASLRDLKRKCKELEEINGALSKSPTEEVAQLQEELVAIKLREGESGLALEENQKRLHELNKLWKTHIENCPSVHGSMSSQAEVGRDCPGTDNFDSANENIGVMQWTRKVVEMEYSSELKTTMQKVMEMETKQHITGRQISRRDEEILSLKEKLEENNSIQRDLRTELNEADRRFADLEAKRKEDIVMWKIEKMEIESVVAELTQTIAQLESQREESLTSSIMNSKDGGQLQSVVPIEDILDKTDPIQISTKWKDLPLNIMTESIGPLNDICFTPDDPMITSIYINGVSPPSARSSGGVLIARGYVNGGVVASDGSQTEGDSDID